MQEPDSFPRRGGRNLPGLHKRSAEDKGGSCRAPGTESLRKAWFPCLSALWRAEEIAFVSRGQHRCFRGTASPNRHSSAGGLPRICRNQAVQDVPCRSANRSHAAAPDLCRPCGRTATCLALSPEPLQSSRRHLGSAPPRLQTWSPHGPADCYLPRWITELRAFAFRAVQLPRRD